jgi:hypothetical protein
VKKPNAARAEETQIVKEAVRSFVQDFGKYFDLATLYDKKLILPKCINTITIDREIRDDPLLFYEVPTAIPQIGEMIKKNLS